MDLALCLFLALVAVMLVASLGSLGPLPQELGQAGCEPWDLHGWGSSCSGIAVASASEGARGLAKPWQQRVWPGLCLVPVSGWSLSKHLPSQDGAWGPQLRESQGLGPTHCSSSTTGFFGKGLGARGPCIRPHRGHIGQWTSLRGEDQISAGETLQGVWLGPPWGAAGRWECGRWPGTRHSAPGDAGP